MPIANEEYLCVTLVNHLIKKIIIHRAMTAKIQLDHFSFELNIPNEMPLFQANTKLKKGRMGIIFGGCIMLNNITHLVIWSNSNTSDAENNPNFIEFWCNVMSYTWVTNFKSSFLRIACKC